MNIENLNEVIAVFNQIGGAGNDNCIFFAQTDRAHIGQRGSVIGEVAKGVANRLTTGVSGLNRNKDCKAVSSNGKGEELRQELNLEALNNYTQFLINESENSIAILPMQFNGVMQWKIEGTQVFPDYGKVIPKKIIEKIEIKKFSFLTPTIRGIKIYTTTGYKIELMGITNVKILPYHIESLKKFIEKYNR